ncbi:hypothetical protein [Hymenobacter terrigena]
MNANKWNWLPPWPVVPPRLRFTAAGVVVAGFSIHFQNEIWPHYAKAQQWSWIVMGLLLEAAGVQIIQLLTAWVRGYRGPVWAPLLMWGIVLPIYGVVALMMLGFVPFLFFGLGSITQD